MIRCLAYQTIIEAILMGTEVVRINSRFKTLFIIDDVIRDESLDKWTQSLLELTISGRHCKHCLWLITQSYMALPKNRRRQTKSIFVSTLYKRQILILYMMKRIR